MNSQVKTAYIQTGQGDGNRRGHVLMSGTFFFGRQGWNFRDMEFGASTQPFGQGE